jgi:hypothetical protein
MAKARDDGIEIRQLGFMRGAMAKILADGLREIIRMLHQHISKRAQAFGSALDGKWPLLGPCALLEGKALLQPVLTPRQNIMHGSTHSPVTL